MKTVLVVVLLSVVANYVGAWGVGRTTGIAYRRSKAFRALFWVPLYVLGLIGLPFRLCVALCRGCGHVADKLQQAEAGIEHAGWLRSPDHTRKVNRVAREGA